MSADPHPPTGEPDLTWDHELSKWVPAYRQTRWDHAAAEAPESTCERCGATADHDTETCCSSHGKALCHACYRRTHFVEVCPCGRPECRQDREREREETYT